jgi:hypothetical protein
MPRPAALTRIVLAFILAAGAVAIWSQLYVRARENYFAGRNLRALAVLAEQIEGAVEVTVHAVRNAPIEDTRAKEIEKLAKAIESSQDSVEKEWLTAERARLQATPAADPHEALRLIPSVKLLPDGEHGLCKAPPCTRSEASRHREVNGAPGAAGDGHSTGSVGLIIPVGRCEKCRFGRLDLSRMLDVLVRDSALADLDVFMTDEQGQTLFQSSGSLVRVSELPETTPKPEKSETGSGPDKKGSGSCSVMPSAEELRRATWSGCVQLASMRYRLFTQPIRLTFEGEEKPRQKNGKKQAKGVQEHDGEQSSEQEDRVWVIGALVPEYEFQAEARTISSSALAALVLLALIGLLALPVLKLWTLGPRERLRWWDVHLLAGTGVLAVALVTVLIGSLWLSGFIARQVDDEMDAVSRSLRANFATELKGSLDLLMGFAECRATNAPSGEPTRLRLLLERPAADWCATAVAYEALQKGLTDYPHVEMLILADATGQQLEKWTVRGQYTRFLNMSGYAVFRDVLERRFQHLNGANGQPTHPFSISVSTSENTGEKLSLLSIEVPSPGAGDARVATMVTRMLSLTRPVLPPGLEFAVIDERGGVAFHSRDGRRLYENLHAESHDSAELRAASLARRAMVGDLVYHGRPTRIHAHPIASTPWTLVVLNDMEMRRALVVDAATAAAALFVVYMLLYVVAASCLRLFRSDDWVWPDPARIGDYRLGALVLLGLLCYGLMVVRRGPSVSNAVVAVTIPFAALLFARLLFDRDEPHASSKRIAGGLLGLMALALVLDSGLRGEAVAVLLLSTVSAGAILVIALRGVWRPHASRRVLTASYSLFLLAFLLVVGLLPAIVFHRDAAQQALEILGRWKQVSLARSLAERSQRAAADYRDIAPSEVVASRQETYLDLAAICLAGGGCQGMEARPQLEEAADAAAPGLGFLERAVHEVVNGFLPDVCGNGPSLRREWCELTQRHVAGLVLTTLPRYGEESGIARTLLEDDGSDFSWRSRKRRDGRLETIVRDPRFAAAGWGGATVSIRMPPSASFEPVIALRFLAASMAILVLIVFLRMVTRRVFGLDVDEPEPDTASGELLARGAFLLRPPEAVATQTRAKAFLIDCRTLDPASPPKIVGGTTRVVIDHLEHRLGDHEMGKAMLPLLEEVVLNRPELEVTVISEIDPLSYFAKRLKSPGDDATSDPEKPSLLLTQEEQRRWAEVFCCLRTVRFDFPVHDEGRERKGVRKVLAEECKWTERLRGIQKELVREGKWLSLTKDQLVRHLTDVASAHYFTIWSLCTDEERLVLIHLAEEGFVNPRSWPIVRRLMRRRLVRRSPVLQLMNESFRQFVLEVEPPRQVREWEKVAGTSAYERLRNLLLGALLIGGTFLFVTQPDLLTRSLALLTTLVGGAGATVQLLGYFQRARAAGQIGGAS